MRKLGEAWCNLCGWKDKFPTPKEAIDAFNAHRKECPKQ